MSQLDPNDYVAFHAVAVHGGFTAGARALNRPKGTLSKRVARIERELGVRLLERSTRRLRLTDVGRDVLAHADRIVAALDAAAAVAAETRASPRGLVRVSSPQGLIQDFLSELIPEYLRHFPDVRVELNELNRPADLVTDGIDLALRVRQIVQADATLVVRRLGRQAGILVASERWLRQRPGLHIDDLTRVETLAMRQGAWSLIDRSGVRREIDITPRFFSDNLDALRNAALGHLGVALLPEHACQRALQDGALIRVLPEWRTDLATIYGVFSRQRALTPALRTFVDFLAAEIGARSRPL